MVFNAGRPKIIRDGTKGQDQIIISDAMLGYDLLTIFVKNRRYDHLSVSPINRLQTAIKEPIAPTVPVASIPDLIHIGIQRSGRDLVQQGFPNMGLVALDQDDVIAVPAKSSPQPTHQFQPASPTADDDNLSFHS